MNVTDPSFDVASSAGISSVIKNINIRLGLAVSGKAGRNQCLGLTLEMPAEEASFDVWSG